jgi:hypothetical protein
MENSYSENMKEIYSMNLSSLAFTLEHLKQEIIDALDFAITGM